MGRYLVITFHSTHHALKAERVMRDCGLEAKTIPVPRSISSNCGIALRVEAESGQDLEILLGEGKVPFDRVWANPTF